MKYNILKTNNTINIFFIKLLTLNLLISISLFADIDKKYSNSIVRLNISYSNPKILQPWQKTSPKMRYSQAIAIGPYKILTLANLVQNSNFIQVLPAFQTEKIPAKIVSIDYTVNLCIIEVDKNLLSRPFTPVKFKSNIKLSQEVKLIWLTHNRKFIHTKGRIESAKTVYDIKSGVGFIYYDISSESSPEGYSEAIFQGNHVIGIASSFNSNKKSSTILPSKIIQNYIYNSKQKIYKSVPKSGFNIAYLDNTPLRSYYKLPLNEKRGILIKDVFDWGTGSSEFKKFDILLNFAGYDIDSLGVTTHKYLGKLPFWFILSDFNVDDSIEALIWRDGKKLKLPITMKSFDESIRPIPYIQFDKNIKYTIQSGFIFQELTFDYLINHGKNWHANINPIVYDYYKNYFHHKIKNKNKIILLNHVLRHPINQGYEHLRNKILTKINDKIIKDIDDVIEIFSTKNSDESEYFKLQFEAITIDVIIPKKYLDKANEDIMKLYNIQNISYEK